MTLLERYKMGLITRREYLDLGNFPCDIDNTYDKNRLKEYAYKYYFGRVRWYVLRINVEEELMREDVIDFVADCKNFTPGERQTHPNFVAAFNNLIDAIDSLMPPVPI